MKKACRTGKDGFKSATEAYDAKRRIKDEEDRDLQVYRCNKCRKWHLGNKHDPAYFH